MNNQELRNLLINKIKEIGKIPKQIEIEGSIYNWSGGQRVGTQQLYKYRENKIDNSKEKQILL